MKNNTSYRIWILFALTTVVFIIYYQYVFTDNHYDALHRVERNFSKAEVELDNFLKQVELRVNDQMRPSQIPSNDNFFLHIYNHDTLVFWNTNHIPISKFADLHFPTSGITKSSNGWYYVKTIEKGNYTISGSFLIKREFSYENNYLQNDFANPFDSKLRANISLDESNGYPIYDQNKKYVFSILVDEYQPASEIQSLILLALIVTSFFLFILQLNKGMLRIKSKWVYLYPLSLLFIRYLSLEFSWFSFMKHTELFKASLYGTSFIFPNLFEFIVNTLLLLLLAQFFYKKFKSLTVKNYNIFNTIALLLNYPTWAGAIYLMKGLVENSSIPMHIETLFNLNIYSLIAIFCIAILGFTYFIITKTIIQFTQRNNWKAKKTAIIVITLGIIYFITDQYLINKLGFGSAFPIAFILLVILLEYRDYQQKHLITGMALLAVYSLVCALTISEFNFRKDKSERELYANQLINERDVTTELEYNKLEPHIVSDKVLVNFISNSKNFSQRELETLLETRHFNRFWDRYEIAYNFFIKNEEISPIDRENRRELYLEYMQILDESGQQSEFNNRIYFIKDYTNQYSYIIRQPITGKNGEHALLFITLKSKKFPEEIGFPRLLLSNESAGLQHLEKYSVAKYHRNKLVSKYGKFNYPNTLTAFKKANTNRNNNFDYDGYNHFIHYKSGFDVVVLSGINITWLDEATSFSYLFCFFGILLLPIYLRFYSNSLFNNSFALSTKIQVALISIVTISLIASALASGFFVSNKYNDNATLALREKSHSLELELKARLGKNKKLTIEENGTALTQILTSLSKIYNTDINFYDKDGFLIATSRQKVFNAGLLSEQINAQAKKNLIDLEQSDYIHKESIGELTYSSAYCPLFNNSGKLLGYLNLQHFGQQEESEQQIQQFLMSVINIFVLLLAASAVTAIFVANWITNPLQMLKERFSNIHFGQSNQPIIYHKEDEIGALVKSYNQKIEELEYTATQLAKSERESAWRDMAKQVAHEIKNPLTPMKLSVQHLLRSFDPQDPNAMEKINRVSNSLIEQIDALTRIANEFSNFAKMPKPEFDLVNISTTLKSAVDLFAQSTTVKLQLSTPDEVWVRGDKEQLLRVFNNLIKNGIQAIEKVESGLINIRVEDANNYYRIEVEDNGSGISEEQRNKIFTPYFTTKSTGSGIGLAMVKQIILNHQGDIYFKSELGKGTTFTIEIPKS